MKISHTWTARYLVAGMFCAVVPLNAAEQGGGGNTMVSATAAENGVRLVTGDEAEKHFAEQQRRLADPKERAAMPAAAREGLESQYPDLSEELGIEPEIAAKLLDLLADQGMVGQERFYKSQADMRRPAARGEPGAFMSDMAAAETRDKEQIRALIGDTAFERYLSYDITRYERMEVARFNSRLDAADRLTAEQKDKMVAQIRARQEKHVDSVSMRQPPSLQRMLNMSPEERQLDTLKRNIELNEEHVRYMHGEKREGIEQARAYLTPKQLEIFSQWEDDRIATARGYVQKMRASVGMNLEFDDERPPVQAEEPARFEGRVRLEMYVKIDRNEPVTVDLTSENGKAPPAFEIAPGLWAEATPVLYADGTGYVQTQYYEDRGGKRVPMRGKLRSGVTNRQSPLPLGSGGGSGTTISGAKSYSSFTEVRLTPAP